VPSFVSEIPPAWTDLVIEALTMYHVDPRIIVYALDTLRARGTFRFAITCQSALIGYNGFKHHVYVPPTPGPQRTLGQASSGDKERGEKAGRKLLEEQYTLAQRTGNAEGMVRAAEAFYKLLDSPQFRLNPQPGRGVMERQRESWLAAREDVLREAPNLGQVVRRLGHLELWRLNRALHDHIHGLVRSSPRRRGNR
jgi:hypothetical protein